MARELDLGSVIGPTGPKGEDGAKGADGATWLFGTNVPSAEGKNGDFYLKTDSFEVYKKGEGSWEKVGSIKGDKGDAGPAGPAGQKGEKGEKGDQGNPFAIKKIYDSIANMNSGYATDEVKQGEFVIITTEDVNNADNAKLFVKGATKYDFVTDLSGAQGIQGPSGPRGEAGPAGEKGADGQAGAKGERGEQGPKGDTPNLAFQIKEDGHLYVTIS